MNDRPSPTIIVQGYCASGKSTLAHLIAVALEEHGINAYIKDDEAGVNGTDYLDKRIEALKAKGAISIEVVQLNRPIYDL
jgi:tRNA uridine 5-carbamoylmethylation protein Kti12